MFSQVTGVQGNKQRMAEYLEAYRHDPVSTQPLILHLSLCRVHALMLVLALLSLAVMCRRTRRGESNTCSSTTRGR